jgi:hypothetical protein
MIELMPAVKSVTGDGKKGRAFTRIRFALPSPDLEEMVRARLWDLAALECSFGPAGSGPGVLDVTVRQGLAPEGVPPDLDGARLRRCGYSLRTEGESCRIEYSSPESLCNAVSTLKQIVSREGAAWRAIGVSILDYPSVDIRSMSTTFAWYAGYGRIGFDSQLWGFEEWKQFLDICADFKINQLNMCMYGYWPFTFDQYPDTCLKNIPLKIWNPESGSWVEILYTHPNLSNEFLSRLIRHAHLLSIRIFAYVGLNSYNGGYSNIHRDKRMKLPPGSRFVNDFDSLCLSDPQNIEYLTAAMRRVVQLGLDGIVFEESEEAYWFCSCEACRRSYGERTASAAEAKHEANYVLLRTLHAVIKQENPSCEVGLRAWREPPLEKSEDYLRHCAASIPADVCLYWAPGLYVPDAEFEKWIAAFGAGRICARDTESNAWSSTQGRLIRIFESNVLRSGDETNDQFIEKDIRQHRGSVARKVRGINGFLFEWYGYFLHLLVHASYGWGADAPEADFYGKAVRHLFGDEPAGDILFVLQNVLTIHESQVKLFPAAFPFLKNKVSVKDLPAIRRAQRQWPVIDGKLARIIEYCASRERCAAYAQHFRKIRNAHQRNRHIYDLCVAAVRYDNETDPQKKTQLLREISAHNEKDFEVVRGMFLDVLPVDRTGVRSCMYPYHELKRVLDNALGRNVPPDEQMIFLGVEALGWLWI